MPSFIIPGIYPEVLQNTSGTPVPDDALSIIGIVGTFARGPLQTPTAVSDPSQAALIFGDADNLSNPNFLTGMWAVYEAMNQGAKQVVIVRVGNAQLATLNLLDFVTDTTAAAVTANVAPQAVLMTGNPLTEGFTVGQTVHIGGVGPEDVVLTAVTATTISAIFTANHLGGVSVTQQALVASVAAPTPGTFGNSYTVQVAAGSQPNTVKLLVTGDGKSETWDNLTMTPGTSRYLPTYVNANSTLLVVTAGASPNLPAILAQTVLSGGTNGQVTTDADYIGVAAPTATGFYALENQDVNLLVAAGQSSAAVHTAMVVQANAKGDRIAVVGGALGDSVSTTLTRAAALSADRAVLCYPGMQVYDPAQNLTVKVPSAYTAAAVAGRIATLDPYISPSNQLLTGILGFEVPVNDADLATLIQGGVVVATNKGRLGFRLRDGVTTGTDFPFTQINIRRLFDQIVRGVTEGNQDLISAPNNADTQHALQQGISAFMDSLAAQGAIQQYYVKVYSSQADQEAGFLYADIGIFPTYAADFIVIRIKPNDAGSFDSSVVNQ